MNDFLELRNTPIAPSPVPYHSPQQWLSGKTDSDHLSTHHCTPTSQLQNSIVIGSLRFSHATRSHRCLLVLEGARHEGIYMKYSAKQRKIWITCSYGRVLLPPPYASHFIHLESWGYFSLWSTVGVPIKKLQHWLWIYLPTKAGQAWHKLMPCDSQQWVW